MPKSKSQAKGAPVLIPETVIFSRKLPQCLLKYDEKDDEIKMIKDERQLKLPELMKQMMNTWRARKKGKPKHKASNAQQAEVIQQRAKGITMAIVRYQYKGNHKLLSENEFMKMMMARPGSKEFNDVSYIQNYIITPGSFVEMLIYQYLAPYDPVGRNNSILYSLDEFAISDEELKKENIKEYARKICTIIGKFMSKEYNIVNKK